MFKTFQPALPADAGFSCGPGGWGVEVDNNTMQKELHQQQVGLVQMQQSKSISPD